VILGEREIGMGMLELVNRDSSAVAEITAADAVAAALGAATPAPRPPEPSPDPEDLLEEIETTPVQHADTGPAEPPAMVSAFGEEPDKPAEPEPPAAPVPDSLPYKARQPARTPATPFNPEVAPPEPAEN
jgi:CPA2 family monovalent cation:H+ antiporter-2